jgi:predicted RecA/RadA family phage recombinase
MPATFVHDESTIDFLPAVDVAAGEVVVLGDLAGITKGPIAANTLGSLSISGVFDLPKASESAFAPGDNGYWDAVAEQVVASPGFANAYLGKVVRSAASGDATVRIRLSQHIDSLRSESGQLSPVLVPVESATIIAVGDLVSLNTGYAEPANQLTDQGTEQSNQSLFASRFAGVALEASADGETTPIRVATAGIYEFDAPTIDVEIGDLVGGVNNAEPGLENRQMKPVRRPEVALGLATESGFGLDTVKVRIVSRAFGPGLFLPSRYTTHPRLLGDSLTLDCDDGYLQFINPDGANRDVVLPKEAASRGLSFVIYNAAATPHTVTVKASNGSTTVSTLPQGSVARLECDGTTWRGLVGTHG